MTLSDNEKADGYNIDTEVKVKHVQSCCALDLKLTPSKVKAEQTYHLEQLNGPTYHGFLTGRLEHKIGNDKPDLTAGVSYAVPKINDDVGAYLEGNVTYKGLKNWVGDFGWLLSVRNQFFVGSQITANLEEKKAKEITGVVGAVFNGNNIYMHANCLEHIVRVGFSSTEVLAQLNKFAAETEIKLNEKGPIEDRTSSKVAFDWNVNPDTLLKIRFDITKKVYGHFSMVHHINKNLSLTFTDYCNPVGFFKNSGKEEYKLGLALEASF